MTQPDHSKIINKTAKKIFGVYGIKQKGQSRIWLDDNGWFTTIIEFQPFRGRQGTTLNVGVNFNWYENEYFSFDIGYRQDVDFVEYNGNDERFLGEVEKFCKIALNKILKYREWFKDLHNAKFHILNHTFTSENIWGSYHKGMICGLTNEFDKRNDYFKKILKNTETFEWITELKNRVNFFTTDLNKQNDFTEKIIEIIEITRRVKKLPERKIKLSE